MSEKIRIELWINTFNIYLNRGYYTKYAAEEADKAVDLFVKRFNDEGCV